MGATCRRIAQRAFGNCLKERRLSDIGKPNLEASQRLVILRHEICANAQPTMPLFKLFPGLPKRSFFSSSFFLGGIFFRRVEYLLVKIYETGKEEKFVRERKRSLPEDSSKGVFGEVKKERDHK